MAKTHYEILGVAFNTERVLIKKAYNKLVLQYHPDKQAQKRIDGQYTADTAALFRAVQEAWECLSDPILRDAYDLKIQRSAKKKKPTNKTRRSLETQTRTPPEQHAKPQQRSGPQQNHQNETGVPPDKPDVHQIAKEQVASLPWSPSRLRNISADYQDLAKAFPKNKYYEYFASACAERADKFEMEEAQFFARAPDASEPHQSDYKVWKLDEYIRAHPHEWKGAKEDARKLNATKLNDMMKEWRKWCQWGDDCSFPLTKMRYQVREETYWIVYWGE